MGWIWHQTQPAALLFNSTRCFFSWILLSLFCEYFQIHRQPDPYISHCVDSWADTAIQVPESTNYSLAVDRCSKCIWKYFFYTLVLHWYSLLIISCVVPLQLCQRMCHQKAIAEACNCYWPSLSLPSFGEFSTSFSTYNKYILTRLFSVTFSLHRTPCSIKLVDNPERDCYADVMADFDNEIMLFQPKIISKGIILLLQEMSLWDGMWWATVPEQGQLIRINPNNNTTLINPSYSALNCFSGKHLHLAVRAVLARSRIGILWSIGFSGLLPLSFILGNIFFVLPQKLTVYFYREDKMRSNRQFRKILQGFNKLYSGSLFLVKLQGWNLLPNNECGHA